MIALLLLLLAVAFVHRFEVIVGLLAAVIAVLTPLTVGVWRISRYVTEQTDATKDNTCAIRDLDHRLERVEQITGQARDIAAQAPQAIADAIHMGEPDV